MIILPVLKKFQKAKLFYVVSGFLCFKQTPTSKPEMILPSVTILCEADVMKYICTNSFNCQKTVALTLLK